MGVYGVMGNEVGRDKAFESVGDGGGCGERAVRIDPEF